MEVLFAMFFLSIIVFGTLRLQTSNLILTKTQASETQGHFLASQSLEVVEALGAGAINMACGAPPCVCELSRPINDYNFTCTGLPEALDGFERSVLVDNTGLSNNAWLVTSQVKWTDNLGEHSAEARRIISP